MLTLDELFKKTTSKPCIYWLPLTGAGRRPDVSLNISARAQEAAAQGAQLGAQLRQALPITAYPACCCR